MAAVLAPWPWLEGGATAVLVATVFDGATVDEELLCRGGPRVAARLGAESLGDGAIEVRLGACGFELVVPRACDGDVAVGGRAEALRELSLCGVTVLPVGPRTRVTVRAGLMTFVVAGTTPPTKVPLAPPVSWRRRAGVAVAALAGAVFAMVLQATAPRTPSWTIPDTVRVRVALIMPSLRGGRAASVAREAGAERAAPTAVAATAAAPARATATATAAATAAAAAAARASTKKAATAKTTPTTPQARTWQANDAKSASSAAAAARKVPNRDGAAQLSASRAGERAAAAAAGVEDARRAAAAQARAAGVVGVLAQYRASFLGDVHVAAADAFDTGSIALGAGDRSSARGRASGNDGATGAGRTGSSCASGSRDGATGSSCASGSGDGASGRSGASGNSDGASGSGDGASGRSDATGVGSGAATGAGALSGDDIGDAYGAGGLGLSGTGAGGGAGDATLGLGDIGTIGRGSGGGTGVGYGSGVGGLGGRRAAAPDVVPGSAAVRGSCDKDLIRRVVRAHVNELRFCYERVLQSRPTLAGRVATRFVIGFDGRVTSSAIAASALTPAVDACVADAIQRWQFAPRCVGEVDYPFLFEPVASAP